MGRENEWRAVGGDEVEDGGGEGRVIGEEKKVDRKCER